MVDFVATLQPLEYGWTMKKNWKTKFRNGIGFVLFHPIFTSFSSPLHQLERMTHSLSNNIFKMQNRLASVRIGRIPTKNDANQFREEKELQLFAFVIDWLTRPKSSNRKSVIQSCVKFPCKCVTMVRCRKNYNAPFPKSRGLAHRDHKLDRSRLEITDVVNF